MTFSVLIVSLLRMLSSAAVLCVLLLCFSGYGRIVARRRTLPFRAAAGMIICYVAVSLLGFTGLLSGIPLWLILSTGCLLAFLDLERLRQDWSLLGGPHLLLLLLFLPLVSLLPASRDALNHHLVLPRLWLESGALVRPDWCFYFSYPHLGESLYALLGGTLGFRFARVLSLAPLALAAIAAGGVFRRGWRRMLATIVIISIPEAFRNATWSYVDSFVVLFALLAFLELRGRSDRPSAVPEQNGWIAWPLLWAAAASSAKYNGLVVLMTVLIWVLVFERPRVGKMLPGLAVALLMMSAWMLPNLLRWGNPVYPLLQPLLGPGSELGQRAEELVAAYRQFTASVTSAGELVALPVALSINGRWDDPRRFDGASGPLLLLGVLLFAILVRRGERAIIFCSVSYLLVALALILPAVRIRYLLPGLCPLVIPATRGLIDALGRKGLVRVATICGLVAGSVWSGYWIVRLYRIEHPFRNLAAGEEYLSEHLPSYRFLGLADEFVESGPDADTLLLVNLGNRGFYAPGVPRYESWNFPFRILEPLWEGQTALQLLQGLRADGIDYIALDLDIASENIVPQLSDEQLEQWREFLAQKTELLISSGPYVLLRLLSDEAM